MKKNLSRKTSKDNMLDELIKAAKKEDWAYVDKKIATIKDYEPFISWAFPTAIHDSDGNLRDLGVSLIEKAPIKEDEFKMMRPQLFKLMQTDPNTYVRFRSAFALAAHGPGRYSKEVIQTLKKAEKDKEVATIAKQYLKKF
ncbi:MAG: hypothetical protein V1645_02915 [archaeon]